MVCCCRLDFHHCLEHRIIFFSSLVSCDWVKGGNLLSIGTGEFFWYELTQNTINGKLFCFILDSANCPHDPGYKIFRSRLRWCVQWVGFMLYLTSFIILRNFVMTCNSFVGFYYLQSINFLPNVSSAVKCWTNLVLQWSFWFEPLFAVLVKDTSHHFLHCFRKMINWKGMGIYRAQGIGLKQFQSKISSSWNTSCFLWTGAGRSSYH